MPQAGSHPAQPPARPREHALLAWLEDAVARLPDKVLVHSIDQDRAISFAEMYDMVGRVGAALRARGIGANDRVALLSGNALEHLIVYLGTMCHGATICTVQADTNRAHMEEILRALDAALVLHEDGLGLDALEETSPGEWQPLGRWDGGGGEGFFAELAGRPGVPQTPLNAYGDVASIFYTSGTASKPKGVVCTFAELLENTEPTADAFGIGEDGPGPRLPFLQLDVGPGAELPRPALPRGHALHGPQVFAEPLFRLDPGIRHNRRRRQSDHDQHAGQPPGPGLRRRPPASPLHHLQLGRR